MLPPVLGTQIIIYIYTEFKEGPWGGGNQFLKALKKRFVQQGNYAEDPASADVVLFNSHHNLKNVVRLKRKYPEKIFVHRVDGPMAYRGRSGEKLDRKIFRINSLVADGTVFQSDWSRQESHKKGMKTNKFEVVVNNAPDPEIFFSPKQKTPIGGKIKLISTSWSNNINKGFDTYHFLDENLDFEKYEMTFVGKIDKPFKNITVIAPLPSSELAEQLRQHDIFIFASKIEACSNSLLEAIHCGLPSVVRNTSSNPEVLGKNGVLFDDDNIIDKIEQISKNFNHYHKLPVKTIEHIGKEYLLFIKKIKKNISLNCIVPKKIMLTEKIKLSFSI